MPPIWSSIPKQLPSALPALPAPSGAKTSSPAPIAGLPASRPLARFIRPSSGPNWQHWRKAPASRRQNCGAGPNDGRLSTRPAHRATPLAERLGAEGMRDLVRAFLEASLAEVHRYGGTAPQFTGDGFMALFGAPLTQEDHVRRAVLAVLLRRPAASRPRRGRG